MNRKISISIMLSIFTLIVKAQIPTPGGYITNTTMAPFHGIWQWTSGLDTVKIYLATRKITIDNYYADVLVGWHSYKKGNTVVESSLGNTNILGTQTIYLWNSNQYGDPRVEGTIRDLSKASKVNILYLTINPAQSQLVWECTESEGHIYPSSMPIPPAGITLPRNMVLQKQ